MANGQNLAYGASVGEIANVVVKKGVRTTYTDYDKNCAQWQRCRDVIAGTDAVKAGGTNYLPKLSQQTQEDYLAMLNRANFYNATGRTVQAMLSMIFRKPATIEVPDNVTELLKNTDMSGSSFDMFVRDLVNEVLKVGRCGLLVDFAAPVAELNGPMTLAKAQELGQRPVMKMYTAENIINWKYTTVDNASVLSRVVLHETISTDLDEWTTTDVEQWRVLDLDEQGSYRVRIFQIGDDGNDLQIGNDVYPVMNGNKLKFIPFKFMTPDGNNSNYNEPPILDLVDVNLSHFKTSADYEHGCHFTALPMLYIAGMSNLGPDGKPVAVYVGSQSALIMPSPEAKAGYIEFTGQGLSTLESNMDRKEAMMATLGAKLLAADKKAPETAFTTAMSKAGENSVLASTSISASEGMEEALYWFCLWAGNSNIQQEDINFLLNRDFLPVAIDGPTLASYVAAYQAGGLTQEELFDLFQRGDLIEADVNFEDHQTQIKAEQAEKQQQALELAKAQPAPASKPSGGGNPGIENPKPPPAA